LYKTSKEFLMRFGLSDLDELPSLKEFEALAREALGSDEGVAPSEASDESVLNAPHGNTISTNGDVAEQAVVATSEEASAESQVSTEAAGAEIRRGVGSS
jgi:segregation and condensation protein B